MSADTTGEQDRGLEPIQPIPLDPIGERGQEKWNWKKVALGVGVATAITIGVLAGIKETHPYAFLLGASALGGIYGAVTSIALGNLAASRLLGYHSVGEFIGAEEDKMPVFHRFALIGVNGIGPVAGLLAGIAVTASIIR